MIGFKKTEIVKKEGSPILYSGSSDLRHKTGLRLVGFCAIAKDYFQACALRYFWAFLLPAAVVVEGHQSDLLKVPFFITKEEYTIFVKAKRKASLAGCKNNVFSSWKSYLI